MWQGAQQGFERSNLRRSLKLWAHAPECRGCSVSAQLRLIAIFIAGHPPCVFSISIRGGRLPESPEVSVHLGPITAFSAPREVGQGEHKTSVCLSQRAQCTPLAQCGDCWAAYLARAEDRGLMENRKLLNSSCVQTCRHNDLERFVSSPPARNAGWLVAGNFKGRL